MGSLYSQVEDGESQEHDLLVVSNDDAPPPPYQDASASGVFDEEAAIQPPKYTPPTPPTTCTESTASAVSTASAETPEPSYDPSNPSVCKDSIVQTLKGFIVGAAKKCGRALKKLSENRFARPFVVTGIILTRILLVIVGVVAFPIYFVLHFIVSIPVAMAMVFYPEGFEDEEGAPYRFKSWFWSLPNLCDCDD